MSGTSDTLAVVGAVGGAGTTRCCLEMGATLARTGEDVAVLDAAFATQGLADYVEGRIEPDLTRILLEDAELDDAGCEIAADVPGSLTLYPTRAPFERLARAKTAGAAEQFERTVATAALSHDTVLVDVPPIAANQAVAAVNACGRTAVVTPDTARGADGLPRCRDRLDDLGQDIDAVVGTFAEGTEHVRGDTAIPTADVTAPGACPTCVDPVAIAPAVAEATACALDRELDLSFESTGRLGRVLPGGA